MNAIRWTIQDRASKRSVTVAHPITDGERSSLKVGIKALSRLSVRGASLYEG